jgi:hypothetical protein
MYYYYFRRQSQSCPIDSLPLSIDGLFPDNYTKREIYEQTVTCLNNGCDAVVPLLEVDEHYTSCKFNKNPVSLMSPVCIFNLQVCFFFFFDT